MNENSESKSSQEELSELRRIRREKLEALQREGHDPFAVTSFACDARAKDIVNGFADYEGKEVSLAGRIMSRRDMGKASFADLRDASGRIQLYVKIDDLGPEQYEEFGRWDLGDIAGVTGSVFRTRRGEISVHVHTAALLSKSLNPLPDKWHGLKDTDLRYRQRYLDLLVSPEVKDTFVKRSHIISATRRFLEQRGFLEVETPVLHTIAGGAAARPFITHHNTLDMDMYLRIALELHLKRLIIGGFDRVYEIGRVFRNEGISVRHNPEFTLLELYQAYTDIHGMMELTESLVRQIAREVLGTGQIRYGELDIDLDKPFEVVTMAGAVLQHAGVDFKAMSTVEEARAAARAHHIAFEERHGVGGILELFFERYVEDKLVQPTFVTEHPVEISPFAKRKPGDPLYTERFELFMVGREIANAFSELNDPIDQRRRFEHQMELRAKGDEEAGVIDEDFLTAMEYGMPPTGGLGIGMDRLVMLLTDSTSIRDVLLFPAMKPRDL
jgi:lysyl-tRNA synthetase class 2